MCERVFRVRVQGLPQQQRDAQGGHRVSGGAALGRQTHDLSEMGQTDLNLLVLLWLLSVRAGFHFVREQFRFWVDRADNIRTYLPPSPTSTGTARSSEVRAT